MKKSNSRKSISTYILSFLIISTIIIIGVKHNIENPKNNKKKESIGISLQKSKEIFPEAREIKLAADSSITVYDKAGDEIGNIILSDHFEIYNYGYAGNIPIAIGVDKNEKVAGVKLLRNRETPRYIRYLEKKKFIDSWDNIELSKISQKKVEALSGATMSCDAIELGVQGSIAKYLAIEKVEKKFPFLEVANYSIFALIMLCALLMAYKPSFRKYRTIHLILLVLVLGFIANKMLSITLFYSWTINGLPWQTNIESIILLALAILIPILGKNRFYCMQLCPIGALQELTSKISPFKKRRIPFIRWKYFSLRELYMFFIWISLLLNFTLPIEEMEPFGAFSINVANWFILSFALLTIIASLFFNRPWCDLCPTGCTIDSTTKILRIRKAKK